MKNGAAVIVSFLLLSTGAVYGENPSCEIRDITWTLGPNIPEFRKGGCATALGGKIISVFGMRQPWGEMDTMYVYDPEADWWQKGVNGPIGQTYVQGTECEGSYYSIGGRSAKEGGVHKRCFRLETLGGRYRWSESQSLNESRGWAPSVSIGRRLFVFGGAKGGHGPTMNGVEMLDLDLPDKGWQKVAEIPGDSRGWLGAAAVGGKTYVLGGLHFFDAKPEQGPDRKRLNEVWMFDPEKRTWNQKSPLPFRLAGFDCCVFRDRYIIVVGGAPEVRDFSDEMKRIQERDRFFKSYYSPFVLVYDTEMDRWHRMASVLPVPTNDIRVVALGNKLYALGGENVEPATSNTTPWLRVGEIHTSKGTE